MIKSKSPSSVRSHMSGQMTKTSAASWELRRAAQEKRLSDLVNDG